MNNHKIGETRCHETRNESNMINFLNTFLIAVQVYTVIELSTSVNFILLAFIKGNKNATEAREL